MSLKYVKIKCVKNFETITGSLNSNTSSRKARRYEDEICVAVWENPPVVVVVVVVAW
jgi:hypothetical protein